MVRPKTARKGKKDWRRNISDEKEIDELVESTYAERSGHAPEKLANNDLFFVDKSGEGVTPAKPGRRGRREKKPLRCEMIVNGSSNSIPVAASSKKSKTYDKMVKQRQVNKAKGAIEARAAQAAAVRPKQQGDLWEDGARPSGRARGLSVNGAVAVEVCAPGCSYNPEYEAHQDAIANAVADELRKEYKAELAPKAPPLLVAWRPEHDDELMRLQTIVGGDESASGSESEGEGEGEGGKDKRAGPGKLTRAQRNKLERKRLQDANLEAKRALKSQRQQLEGLKDIVTEVAEDEAAHEENRLRRKVAKEERMASQPRRLGKRRYIAPAVQVLLSEELVGGASLRKLKACPTVARDRYKSLQRRELVEPRQLAPRHTFKRKEFERGSKGVREREEHEATLKERESRKKAKKAAAALL